MERVIANRTTSVGVRLGTAAIICLVVAGCKTYDNVIPEQKTKFTAKSYGVSASPRLAFRSSQLKKGTGTRKVGKPYKVRGRWFTPKLDKNYNEVGLASWYGPNFHGRKTANGEIYDMNHLSAAHPTMPLPSYARVTNLTNGRSVVVRVNDRGPFVKGRIIDLSNRAATVLDTKRHGVAKVRVKYVGPAPLKGNDYTKLAATYKGPSVKGIGAEQRAKTSLIASLKQKKAVKRAEQERIQLAQAEKAAIKVPAPTRLAMASSGETTVGEGGQQFDVFKHYQAFFDNGTATGAALDLQPITALNYAPTTDQRIRGAHDYFDALFADGTK
jgi:rare lipoprotein A